MCSKQTRDNRISNAPIAPSLGNVLLDMGLVSGLPKALLWFYRYLSCNGERLDEREIMPLILLIALRDRHRGYRLRLGDLPVTIPTKTLRGYQTKWKRLGLLFTSRAYYTRDEMRQHIGAELPRTPRLKHVIYDLSNLMHNIALIAQQWTLRNAEHQTRQAARGIGRPAPYVFPDDFIHEIELSPEVAYRIVTGYYDRGRAGEDFSQAGLKRWYIPPQWWHRAHEMAGLPPDLRERSEEMPSSLEDLRARLQEYAASRVLPQNEALRTDPASDRALAVQENEAVRGEQMPSQKNVLPRKEAVRGTYYPNSGQSLIQEEEENDEEEKVSLVLSRFARRKGSGEYRPTDRERDQVRQLLRKGYSVRQIATAIDAAFDTRPPDAKPIRRFGYILHCIHHQSEHPQVQPTEVAGHPDGQPTGAQPAGVQTGLVADDPLSGTYALLQEAQHSKVAFDTPIIRLALQCLVKGRDPYSPEEVHQAVMDTLVRGIAPQRLVGYVKAILKDKRSQGLERQPNQETWQPVAPDENSYVPMLSVLTPADRAWRTALPELEQQMTRATYDSWIRPLTALSLRNGTLILEAPNQYIKDWVENRLRTPIERTISAIVGHRVGIAVEIWADTTSVMTGQQAADGHRCLGGSDRASSAGLGSVQVEKLEDSPPSGAQEVCPSTELPSPSARQSVRLRGSRASQLYTPACPGLTTAPASTRCSPDGADAVPTGVERAPLGQVIG